jgi:hypothetical protein
VPRSRSTRLGNRSLGSVKSKDRSNQSSFGIGCVVTAVRSKSAGRHRAGRRSTRPGSDAQVSSVGSRREDGIVSIVVRRRATVRKPGAPRSGPTRFSRRSQGRSYQRQARVGRVKGNRTARRDLRGAFLTTYNALPAQFRAPRAGQLTASCAIPRPARHCVVPLTGTPGFREWYVRSTRKVTLSPPTPVAQETGGVARCV